MNAIIKYGVIFVCAVIITGCGTAAKTDDAAGDTSGKSTEEVSATPAETAPSAEEDESFFYDYLMKENQSDERELYIRDVQDFGEGKWICAEWRNDGSMIELLYMEKLASGEWEVKERDGYQPPISEGFLLYSGVSRGSRVVSIAANEVYWNMEEDTQEAWDLDYVCLIFTDGKEKDVKISAGERKLLFLEEEMEITDWQLYTKDGKEIYSFALAEERGRVSLGELFEKEEN